MNKSDIIEKHKLNFKEVLRTKENYQEVLNTLLEKNKFLESIYTTGGKNSFYSEEFRESAYIERQKICLETSALYDLLREVQKWKN